MLGFFSNKTIHPLADAQEATRILAEIATAAPLTAVEDSLGWLESLAADVNLKLAQRLEVILKLDEASVAQTRRLSRAYPASIDSNRALESKQWQAGHSYWQQLTGAYLDCLTRQRMADKKEAEAVRAQLPMIYGRLINALAGQLKWKQFHYGPVDPQFWETLGAAYLSAGEAKAAQKPIALYPGGTESTIESEYLKVLIFQATSMDKLQALEIEIAERFIAHFLPCFSLTAELRPDNVYWVDAAKPLPPTRLAKSPDATATLRFFNGARAVEAVAQTMEQIRTEGRVPPTINLGAQYEAAAVMPVLEHLALCWAPKPPMRGTARHRTHAALKVINGLAAVHRRLSGRAGADEAVETWVIDDVSLGGLGAQASIGANDWIRIGALVGMQPAGGDNWLVGVVRRYARSGPKQGSIGIETLSKTPRAVLADAGGLHTEALLFDMPEVGEYVRMAVPVSALEETVALTFILDGKNVRLHPRQSIESGPDFAVKNFFVQSFS